jgi:hypothetical protein
MRLLMSLLRHSRKRAFLSVPKAQIAFIPIQGDALCPLRALEVLRSPYTSALSGLRERVFTFLGGSADVYAGVR